jgi:hypothetical protein
VRSAAITAELELAFEDVEQDPGGGWQGGAL